MEATYGLLFVRNLRSDRRLHCVSKYGLVMGLPKYGPAFPHFQAPGRGSALRLQRGGHRWSQSERSQEAVAWLRDPLESLRLGRLSFSIPIVIQKSGLCLENHPENGSISPKCTKICVIVSPRNPRQGKLVVTPTRGRARLGGRGAAVAGTATPTEIPRYISKSRAHILRRSVSGR